MLFRSNFPTAGNAKDYFDLINQDSKVFRDISRDDYEVFPISADNFSVFYKEKRTQEYLQFFTENYLKKKEE